LCKKGSWSPKYSLAHAFDGATFGTFATLLFWLVLAHALFVLWLGASKPILDLYYFRQTQTALSAYWLWRGGPWLAYETPVLGHPWSIPFEFPLYQGLVALLRLTDVPIDIGGRLVSFSFYLASLWPLWRLFRALSFDRFAFIATGVLFLSSPIYLFWSRTVMIESCALFFHLLWLALLADFLIKPRAAILLCTIAVGTAGAVVKSTTFPAFVLLGGLLILRQFFRNIPSASLHATLLCAVIACVVPAFVGLLWIMYSDSIRAQNPFGTMLTLGGVITDWVFGSWAQRASGEFWRDIVLTRIMRDIFGFGVFFAAIPVLAVVTNRDYRACAVACMIAFITPLVLFTNMHLAHNYYQYANAIFVLGAVGLGIAAIFDSGRCGMAMVILIATASLQLTGFYGGYGRFLTADLEARFLPISLMAKESTSPNGALIIIGTGFSSAIPYYSERKSLAIHFWIPPDLLQRVFENPQAFLGDNQLAGIVFCSDRIQDYSDNVPLIQDFVENHRIIGEAGDCRLLAPERLDRSSIVNPQ
jgi:hypothetical protein